MYKGIQLVGQNNKGVIFNKIRLGELRFPFPERDENSGLFPGSRGLFPTLCFLPDPHRTADTIPTRARHRSQYIIRFPPPQHPDQRHDQRLFIIHQSPLRHNDLPSSAPHPQLPPSSHPAPAAARSPYRNRWQVIWEREVRNKANC
jgi:hypothetical protein